MNILRVIKIEVYKCVLLLGNSAAKGNMSEPKKKKKKRKNDTTKNGKVSCGEWAPMTRPFLYEMMKNHKHENTNNNKKNKNRWIRKSTYDWNKRKQCINYYVNL